jgi:hypothetical protein
MWTLTPEMVGKVGRAFKWKILCTSDGSALSSTDIMPLISDVDLKSHIRASMMMTLAIKPGVAAVAPDNTIDVTLANDESVTIFSQTGISYNANTAGLDLSKDYGQFPVVYDKLYLALNDIGASGDQVTLLFENWIIQ